MGQKTYFSLSFPIFLYFSFGALAQQNIWNFNKLNLWKTRIRRPSRSLLRCSASSSPCWQGSEVQAYENLLAQARAVHLCCPADHLLHRLSLHSGDRHRRCEQWYAHVHRPSVPLGWLHLRLGLLRPKIEKELPEGKQREWRVKSSLFRCKKSRKVDSRLTGVCAEAGNALNKLTVDSW